MNKKKLRKTVIVGIVMFYIISSAWMLLIYEHNQEDKFRSQLSNLISSNYVGTLASNFEDIDIDSKEKADEVAKTFMHYYADSIMDYMYIYNRPFSLALQDRQGNITYLSDNFIYWYSWGDDIYVSLDEYLTDEIRKELKQVRKKKYNTLINDLKLYYDGEKYIPVEVVFRGQGNLYKDYTKTVKFTDYEPNRIIVNNPVTAGVCLFEMETEFYNRAYYPKLKEKINSEYERLGGEIGERFGTEFGAPGFGGTSGDWVGNLDLAIGDGYRMYFAFRYNSYLVTFFSDDYQGTLISLAIMFAVAGIIFYIMFMKVINKGERLEQAKNTFISAASHELKTPLAVIQNQCECVMENIAPEKNESYMQSIYNETLRMNGIVTALLSYNRLQQLTEIKKEKCDLSELLRQEIRYYASFAQKSGVTVKQDIADDVFVECNPQLMKMAIDNYLSNAIKHCTGEKTVEVRLSRHLSSFTLEVTNPAHKESVKIANEAWDEFSRGDKARQRQGESIGMGLAICRKIFELHRFRGYCKYNDGKISFVICGS